SSCRRAALGIRTDQRAIRGIQRLISPPSAHLFPNSFLVSGWHWWLAHQCERRRRRALVGKPPVPPGRSGAHRSLPRSAPGTIVGGGRDEKAHVRNPAPGPDPRRAARRPRRRWGADVAQADGLPPSIAVPRHGEGRSAWMGEGPGGRYRTPEGGP